jgi:hypothetical protein
MTSTFTEPAVALMTADLEGSWRNTNAASRGIPRIDVARREPVAGHEPLAVQVWGAGDHDWGSVSASVFTDAIDSRNAMAFSARFDLGYADVHMQANIKGGVLVVATFNRFKDDSGRSSYFTREFYWRTGK